MLNEATIRSVCDGIGIAIGRVERAIDGAWPNAFDVVALDFDTEGPLTLHRRLFDGFPKHAGDCNPEDV